MATKRKKVSSPRRRVSNLQPIHPCLWFDNEAEDAAKFYVSVFKKGKILNVTRYPAVGREVHGRAPGSVMVAEFTVNGLTITALNGGPLFKFNEAVSLQVMCQTQDEIDYYWEKLTAGGDPKAQQCGWLKDKYGLSWQVVPTGMAKMLKDSKSPATERAFAAMMEMKKIDIAALKKAYKG